MSEQGGARRGSSLFSGPGAMGGSQPAGNRPPQNMQGAAPSSGPGAGGRRNSSVLNVGPGGGVGFGIDFDDSDYEDSDDDDVPHGGPHGGQPLSGAPPQVTGAANSRPMVGGFAAAAYEAAKAHHFQNVAKKQQPTNRGGQQQHKGGRPDGY